MDNDKQPIILGRFNSITLIPLFEFDNILFVQSKLISVVLFLCKRPIQTMFSYRVLNPRKCTGYIDFRVPNLKKIGKPNRFQRHT